jgi:hypothetical protein
MEQCCTVLDQDEFHSFVIVSQHSPPFFFPPPFITPSPSHTWTVQEVHEFLKQEYLSSRKSHLEVFDFLASDGGKPRSWKEIAAACSGNYDPNSPSFRNNIMTKLKSFELIEYINGESAKNKNYGERIVQLTEKCYPHGRPNSKTG